MGNLLLGILIGVVAYPVIKVAISKAINAISDK
jgi:hypothetical protein